MTALTLFDGITYDPALDGPRLRTQLHRVRAALANGAWWTLRGLADQCGGSEAGVSARLRDLRKRRHGCHRISRRRLDGGLWAYRMVA
jgi:hypothetical protein